VTLIVQTELFSCKKRKRRECAKSLRALARMIPSAVVEVLGLVIAQRRLSGYFITDDVQLTLVLGCVWSIMYIAGLIFLNKFASFIAKQQKLQKDEASKKRLRKAGRMQILFCVFYISEGVVLTLAASFPEERLTILRAFCSMSAIQGFSMIWMCRVLLSPVVVQMKSLRSDSNTAKMAKKLNAAIASTELMYNMWVVIDLVQIILCFGVFSPGVFRLFRYMVPCNLILAPFSIALPQITFLLKRLQGKKDKRSKVSGPGASSSSSVSPSEQ